MLHLARTLNHTGETLRLYLDELVNNVRQLEQGYLDLELIHKWECAGSQQSQYKQKFEN